MAGKRNAEASTLAPEAPQPLTQDRIDQRVFDLYDEYCHGHIDRREFLARSAAVTIGGLAMAQALLPRYAQAQTISFTDPADQGALCDLSVAGRHLRHDARISGAAERARAASRPCW